MIAFATRGPSFGLLKHRYICFEGIFGLSCPCSKTKVLDMRQNPFSKYLFWQAFVIGIVLVIFKMIADRQIAATAAGVLFVGLPLVMIIKEFSRAQFENKIWYFAVLQFWLFFALPILSIRLLNWGVAFDQLSFFGVPGPLLHQWSSKSYMLMMLGTGWVVLKHRKK